MADYSNSCKCGRTVHELWCTSHHNYKNWKRAQDEHAHYVEHLSKKNFSLVGKSEHLVWCTRCGAVTINGTLNLHREFCPNPKPATAAVTPPRCPNCKAYVWEEQEHVCRG